MSRGARLARRLKEKDNLRERLADAEERGIPFLAFFGDQELAKARLKAALTLALTLPRCSAWAPRARPARTGAHM